MDTDVLVGWAVDAVLFTAGVLAIWSDVRERRIYNWITYPTIALGLVLALAAGGLGQGWTDPGLRSSVAGLVALGAFFGVGAALGWMGLGDVKLVAGVGALLGFPAALGALLFVSLAGGVMGVATVLARAAPVRALLVRAGFAGAADPAFGRSVPYGVAIAAGSVLFRLWQRLPAPEQPPA